MFIFTNQKLVAAKFIYFYKLCNYLVTKFYNMYQIANRYMQSRCNRWNVHCTITQPQPLWKSINNN